jgi:hypothetical protein
MVLTIGDVAFSRTTSTVAAMPRRVAETPASRVQAPERQHFLKRDTVFFDVLVYSGCSASRFPSARSD